MDLKIVVKRSGRLRRGRGFSQKELKEVYLSFKDALKLKIPIDRRRRTCHGENVEMLRTYLNFKVGSRRKLDITEVKGIGKKTSEKLIALGVDSIQRLAEIDPEQIAGIGVSKKRASDWIENAKQILSGKVSK
jgi:hypothetical protein